MAHLYKRSSSGMASPFWWIKYRNGKGVIVRESTGFLHGNGADTRRAQELEARKTLEERQTTTTNQSERWDAWVLQFIEDRYRNQPASKTRYGAAWRTLRMYLDEIEITMPRQLMYLHCTGYLAWREKSDKYNGKYNAGHNTAVLELKFLALVMKEAVRRGFAQGNPCRELELARVPTKKFPQYTDEDIQMIVDGIKREPKAKQAFLWPSFLVAYYHGVRLVETNVNPKRDVRLFPKTAAPRVGTITFHQKGSKIRVKPLHPELLQLFQPLVKKQATETFPCPKSFAKEWFNFLHRCGMKTIKPEACFHSLRVTVQNRLRRAGIKKEIRKAYLSHDGKDDVNDLYDRVEEDELLVCHAPLNKTWKLKRQATGSSAS